MIVGRYLGRLKSQNLFVKFIRGKLGHLDLHTQLRTKPLMRYLMNNYGNLKEKKIVEIGCGSGNNCFEIFLKFPNNTILGFDLNNEATNLAKKISFELGIGEQINFCCADATKFDYSSLGNVDFLLLIDFLEHISNPENFLESIKDILSENCEILVSVPTYKYKIIFGEKFHHDVGHVKEGYDLEELNFLFSKFGFKPKFYCYNTGIPANIGCFFFYRFRIRNKYLNFLKQLLLYPFSFIDFINSKNFSCSLFVVYVRDL